MSTRKTLGATKRGKKKTTVDPGVEEAPVGAFPEVAPISRKRVRPREETRQRWEVEQLLDLYEDEESGMMMCTVAWVGFLETTEEPFQTICEDCPDMLDEYLRYKDPRGYWEAQMEARRFFRRRQGF
jgi:hypothetical protein